jgi:hypothetical protein
MTDGSMAESDATAAMQEAYTLLTDVQSFKIEATARVVFHRDRAQWFHR